MPVERFGIEWTPAAIKAAARARDNCANQHRLFLPGAINEILDAAVRAQWPAELNEWEQATADSMAARFAGQGVDPERAAKTARALVLEAAAVGERIALADERSGGQDGE